MKQKHSTESVQAHYARLAQRYDQQANQACKRAYRDLVRRSFPQARRILELGAGSSPLLPTLSAPLSISCDLSQAMLLARKEADSYHQVAADAQALPFPDNSFDAIYSINLLEHVPQAQAVFEEGARLLAPGGRFLAVTPNGDWEGLLNLLERLHLKLPEGPHQFLGLEALRHMAGDSFQVIALRRFLLFPAGPPALVRSLDALAPTQEGWGLFLYILLEKRGE